jgi:CheY-like chemotaxis protein
VSLRTPAGSDGAFLPARLGVAARILVIDDETEIADVVRDALSALGHDVHVAYTGGDGVRMATDAPYDLIFTDLGMPDMTGWEVAERIRSGTPRVPVVLVTGWGGQVDPEQVVRRDIQAVVHKPFELAEILRTTARVLERREP